MKTQTEQSKSGHTPGPWSADKWAPGWTVSAPESHYSVCHLEDCNNAEANARLIASAPETAAERDLLREQVKRLCEALDATMFATDGNCQGYECAPGNRCVPCMVREALESVRGKHE